jgi:hypothetical protein
MFAMILILDPYKKTLYDSPAACFVACARRSDREPGGFSPPALPEREQWRP